jgi:uncharacterized protein YjbJ (UPF0337 family)
LPREAAASLQPQSYGRDAFRNLSDAGDFAGISFPIVSPTRTVGFALRESRYLAQSGTTRAPRGSQCNIPSFEKENDMNRDQVKGRAKEVTGKAQKATGRALGKAGMQAKGLMKEAGGKIQKTVGDAREQSKERDRGAE